ncbi:MAG: YggS family pyridoxal phosphate-dependent enzyme [Bacteroidaceae bacterium]|nr:YggS family pyridoxal phosphate-dependent enzyme [Bacteroidaceae bacterium]MBP9637352.1 YggS family pyridoxal phosphate-dependent enzyme [Bacteroidaceae bacterium]
MNEIATHIAQLKKQLPEDVKLLAVSKYHPKEAIMEAYQAGQRLFGESRVQEMTEKWESLPKDIEWHFIGHIQTNKIKYMIPYVSLIHGVDSLYLLSEINKQAQKVNRVVRCLLQLHVAKEETKFGFTFDECREMLTGGAWKDLKNIQITGIMAMASNTDDEVVVRQEFQSVNSFFQEIKADYFATQNEFCEVSMGMSHDYPLAIEEGSTLIRVGTFIFGDRVY